MKQALFIILTFSFGFLAETLGTTITNFSDGLEGSGFFIGKELGEEVQFATAFTTGSNSGGYDLREVSIQIDSLAVGTPGNLFLDIYADDSNSPNEGIGAIEILSLITGTPSNGGNIVYQSSLQLSANTKYWAVLSADTQISPDSSYYVWRCACASDQIFTTPEGWTIDNRSAIQSTVSYPDWTQLGTSAGTLSIDALAIPECSQFGLVVSVVAMLQIVKRRKSTRR